MLDDPPQGLPTAGMLGAPLAAYAGRDAYLCGPAPLLNAVEQALRAAGATVVHREKYFSPADDVFDPDPVTAESDGSYTAGVSLDGERYEVGRAAEVPLPDAMSAAGTDAPFSCREGACSACCCRVVSGDVKMLRNEVSGRGRPGRGARTGLPDGAAERAGGDCLRLILRLARTK